LNVEDAELRTVLESEGRSLFAVGGFEDGQVGGELPFDQLAKVVSLSDIVFGYENRHA